LYPAIANPMSLIGRHINVPGSYWPSQGQNRTELATLYQCVVIDYTSVHIKLFETVAPSKQNSSFTALMLRLSQCQAHVISHTAELRQGLSY
jgi:hypothetical protein